MLHKQVVMCRLTVLQPEATPTYTVINTSTIREKVGVSVGKPAQLQLR